MSELLVRMIDRSNPDDPFMDNMLTKAGDVIAVRPDGWAWSDKERAAPFWKIIKIPGAPVSWGDQFLGREIVDPKEVLNPRPRAVRLDPAMLTKETFTPQELVSAKVVKPATVGAQLGDSGDVL